MTDEFNTSEPQDRSSATGGLVCVELEFATLRRFREEMAPYLNYDGFFARSERPLPRGTSVEFKFIMPEDFILAQGTAVVAWTIEQKDNPELVPGMALRFVEVGKQSRAVVDELVDFQIATGGDPFDLGPAPSGAGEIPTDALGGGSFEQPPPIESPLPEIHELPPIPTPEPPAATVEEEVLPDWLSNASDKDQFGLGEPPVASAETPNSSGEGESLIGSSADRFEVDMIFDDGEKDTTPHRPEEGSFQQMAAAPRPAEKPPRDLRLGLIVTAAIVVVAVGVLMWSFWLRNSGQEAAQTLPQEEIVGEAGVALIEDESDNGLAEGGAPEDGAESDPGTTADDALQVAAETASRVAAELEGEESGTTPSGRPAEGPGDSTREEIQAPAAKDLVREAPAGVQQPQAALARASRVVDVAASARGDATTVVIRGNGSLEPSRLRTLRLEDPDRLWVSVSPIETFYKPNEIGVGSPQVERIRIGYHPEDSPPALYVVLDLAGDDVVLLDTTVQGDSIRLTVGRK